MIGGVSVLRGVFVGVCALLLCGCAAESPAPVTAELIAEGHAEYRKVCSPCHGLNGEGTQLLGKNLHANEFVISRTDDELLDFIIKGRSSIDPENTRGVEMPPRGGNPNLGDDQIRKIVAYMRSLK